MSPALTSSLLLVVAAAQLPQAPTSWTLQGTVAPLGRNRELQPAQKRFQVQFYVLQSSPEAAEVFWLLDEQGRGGWHWSERFGHMTLLPQGRVEGARPALLYQFHGHDYALPLELPWPQLPEEPEPGLQWQAGKLTYHIRRPTGRENKGLWELVAENNYGWQRRWLLEPKSRRVQQVRQRVFMGQGQEHQILMKVGPPGRLDSQAQARLAAGFRVLLALRNRLDRPRWSQAQALSARQIDQVRQALPDLEQALASGPLAPLLRQIRDDLERQTQRTSAVDRLVASLQGRRLPAFSLQGLNGASLDRKGLQGQVTVLHFWEYRHAPLKEPYGQVGYLDFLHHRYAKRGAKVYGVAVNRELAVPARRSAAVRSVRKLAQFMNLSYPVLLDDGKLLDQLGDPRRAGAQLPLFVVVGPEGRVIHAHVGFYAVDRTEGLKQLDQIVRRALEQQKRKQP